MKAESKRSPRIGPPILSYPEKCTGCLICELRCSLRFASEFNTYEAAIRVRRLIGADREYDVQFTELCDNCGLCARYCPYEALVWSKGAQSTATAKRFNS